MFSQPRLEKMTYWGTSSTCAGSIRVPSITAKSARRPGNRSRENANAAMPHERTFPTMLSTTMMSEFIM
ncbi:hypothetical protein OCAE111667_19210 [Occultella aeris]|uniref:Uncharacterized protein n=1 Tax=Occultella aeris TaxID=2761496 RepID=A0A7M4DI18_9MICO|nr:hypothetical protein HALOF300_01769 [Occultella aeris]